MSEPYTEDYFLMRVVNLGIGLGSYLVTKGAYGGNDFIDVKQIPATKYAEIYVNQPELLKELPFKMTEEIEHEILMLSI